MQNKTALIVDDSRTASMTLRRMLEREEFQVDVLGNAEAAVGYLRDHRPGVIFMDNLMPGMNGFQAVREIKSNLLAAQIPIVMYTGNTGELYVGQAQALGAVDILPKPPTRELLRGVFRRLAERTSPANEDLDEHAPAATDAAHAEYAPPVALDESSGADGAIARVDRPIVPMIPAPASEYLRELSAETEAAPGARIGSWAALAAVGALAFMGGMKFAEPRTDVAAPYVQTLAWSLGESLQYPYGEAPFGGARVELVRGLVQKLSAAGFRGTLRLEGHAGQYCQRASSGGWRLADASAALDSCDIKGYFNKQDARTASARQSSDFRAMLTSPEVSTSGIRLVIEGAGDERQRVEYPAPERVRTAGEWNRIAAENNRIGVALIPDA